MQPVEPIQLVTHTNTVVEVLKVAGAGLIGLLGALIGAFSAVRAARKAWEWDSKRDGYLRLFPRAHQLGDHAGLVVSAVFEGASREALEAARENYRRAFAAFRASAVVARVTASGQGEAAINELMAYVQTTLNPYLIDGLPDPQQWRSPIQEDVIALLDALEDAARADLRTRPS